MDMYRPGMAVVITHNTDQICSALKSGLKEWPHESHLRKYKPALCFVNASDLALVTEAVKRSALCLQIRPAADLKPGRVRICTDKKVRL